MLITSDIVVKKMIDRLAWHGYAMPHSKMEVTSELYPYPDDWLDEKRLSDFEKIIKDNIDFYRSAGVHKKIIRYWIKQQVSKEAWDNQHNWDIPEFSKDIESLTIENNQENISPEHEESLAISLGCLYWSEFYWGKEAHSIFLNHKSSLDLASLQMIKVSDKDLVNEIFYQLVANEKSFTKAYDEYSESISRAERGYFPLQPLVGLPYGLNKLVRHLSLNKISPPIRLAKKFVIVQLLDYKSATFDSSTRSKLLSKRFDDWLELIQAHILSRIASL